MSCGPECCAPPRVVRHPPIAENGKRQEASRFDSSRCPGKGHVFSTLGITRARHRNSPTQLARLVALRFFQGIGNTRHALGVRCRLATAGLAMQSLPAAHWPGHRPGAIERADPHAAFSGDFQMHSQLVTSAAVRTYRLRLAQQGQTQDARFQLDQMQAAFGAGQSPQTASGLVYLACSAASARWPGAGCSAGSAGGFPLAAPSSWRLGGIEDS